MIYQALFRISLSFPVQFMYIEASVQHIFIKHINKFTLNADKEVHAYI